MKLRYHHDNITDGFVILELEPQIRTLFISSQISHVTRLPLPYILFVIRYTKENDKFVYPGLNGYGLNIVCTIESIKSVKDFVYFFPTDHSSVCTNHAYDFKVFETLEELTNCVITLWFNMIHSLYNSTININQWRNKNVENIAWEKFGTLSKFLRCCRCGYDCDYNNLDLDLDNLELCNEDFKIRK